MLLYLVQRNVDGEDRDDDDGKVLKLFQEILDTGGDNIDIDIGDNIGNDKDEDILAVLVLHGIVDISPALESKFVSKFWPPVATLHHRLHLHKKIAVQKTNNQNEKKKVIDMIQKLMF